MKKKVKRNYTRKVVTEVSPEASTRATVASEPLGGENVPDVSILPPSLRMVLDAETKVRCHYKLPDNYEERALALIERFKGEKSR